ncbi:MAG TPA: ABC-F family ATP-binding cassette domain-containing protein [Ktedonobacterales bacterium]|nr:ABC-F family ATP-binding cassette domain-containing protein [Ktedonobacterales bacterium]
MLLTARDITKTYGPITVLHAVTFALDPGERAGVVGANGAGKSTLLRILASQEPADHGSVQIASTVAVGYLPQTTPAFSGPTLDDLIRESVGNLRQLEADMRRLEAAMASAASEEMAALLDAYGQAATRFQDRGGYDLDAHIAIVLAGLRLDYLPRDRTVRSLSGGERARAGLAALLLRSPDLLLLDEPTNHLDAATLTWLEDYLAAYAGAALIVSHDRQFLNRTINRIFEIDESTHGLKRYEGDYDGYAAAKAAARVKWEEDYQRQQDEIQELRKRMRETGRQVAHNRPLRDNAKMQYDFKGGRVQNTIARNVRDAETRLARIEAAPVEKPPKPLGFQPYFQSEAVQSKEVLAVEGLRKMLGGRLILRDVRFTLPPRARVALVGPNGAGKTTLLRLLLGLEPPDDGTVRRAQAARIGYLPQDPAPVDLDRTVFETYREGLVKPESTLVASILGNGLFRLDDLDKRVGYLSLGQRRKLEIARLLAEQPNVLVLDEPTNYISLDVLEAFEAAVMAFPGPVLAVSHDRWFLRRFAGDVWELREGELLAHPAGYEYAETGA